MYMHKQNMNTLGNKIIFVLVTQTKVGPISMFCANSNIFLVFFLSGKVFKYAVYGLPEK
jgi:hypothetical protein